MRAALHKELKGYPEADVTVRRIGFKNWQMIANDMKSYSAAKNVYDAMVKRHPGYMFNLRMKE